MILIPFIAGCLKLSGIDSTKQTMMLFQNSEQQVNWLSTQTNATISMSVYCVGDIVGVNCSLDETQQYTITLDDTRLGIPMYQRLTDNGWMSVQGTWRPNSTYPDSVDLRVEYVLTEVLPRFAVVHAVSR